MRNKSSCTLLFRNINEELLYFDLIQIYYFFSYKQTGYYLFITVFSYLNDLIHHYLTILVF
jgi:hypothetical protein